MLTTKRVERFRLTLPDPWSSRLGDPFGAFSIPYLGVKLRVMVSDGDGWEDTGLPGEAWEHASISTEDRCPTWEEMDYIKRTFWNEDDTVIQIHPPASEFVNVHQFCLHLWRPKVTRIPLPPRRTMA